MKIEKDIHVIDVERILQKKSLVEMVGRGGRRWCPNGCGMTVLYYPSGNHLSNYKKCFSCSKCNKNFTIKELIEYAKGE